MTLYTVKRVGLAWDKHFKILLTDCADQGYQIWCVWNEVTDERSVCKYKSLSPFIEFTLVSGAIVQVRKYGPDI